MTEPLNSAPAKRAITLLICKSGQIITQPAQKHDIPPSTIKMPLLTQDQRLFLKDNEIVRPYLVVTFKHRKTMDIAGIDFDIYGEIEVAPFDDTGLQLLAFRSLDKDFHELNKAA